jgi:hypothetical protein
MNLNLKKILYYFLILCLLVVAFFAGYNTKSRELKLSENNPIKLTAPNGYTNNILSQIKSYTIRGLFDSQKKNYGEMFIVKENNKSSLKFKIENVPLYINIPNQKINTPNKFIIKIAKPCCNGLNYELLDTGGYINLDTNINTLSGELNTEYDFLLEADKFPRILLYAENFDNPYSIVKDDERDWPDEMTKKPAPFFWIDI